MTIRSFPFIVVCLNVLQDITYVMGNTTACDAECAATYPGSYCKYWQTPSRCFGSNVPCYCGSGETTEVPRNCDAGCASDTPGSYCKYWATPSTCHSSNAPCTCEAAAVTTTPSEATDEVTETTTIQDGTTAAPEETNTATSVAVDITGMVTTADAADVTTDAPVEPNTVAQMTSTAAPSE
ncbi:conserved hypothetical protein, partial [Perkinsus marinus ATCC 50983]